MMTNMHPLGPERTTESQGLTCVPRLSLPWSRSGRMHLALVMQGLPPVFSEPWHTSGRWQGYLRWVQHTAVFSWAKAWAKVNRNKGQAGKKTSKRPCLSKLSHKQQWVTESPEMLPQTSEVFPITILWTTYIRTSWERLKNPFCTFRYRLTIRI